MILNKQYILFDLDGTISDSKPGILKSMQYVMKHFGIEIKDEELDSYSFFLGPPLQDSFRNYFKFDDKKVKEAVLKYREYYKPKGMFDNKLYPGVKDLLKKLKNSGKTVILATSKAEILARQILEYFDILQYFDFIAGAELDGRRAKKNEVIEYCLAHFGILSSEEKAKAVMIGDRNHDIIGARKNGIESVGVLYGYGSLEELTEGEYKSDYIVKDVDALAELLVVH
ncbi:MAG: HAD hydrolase-like protein [Oscillospiraceae bacterium]|nr:HAD hydrolase-like protein [Oscillospiraceae bacterium]